jgi:hemerythrin-like domain-containing protein
MRIDEPPLADFSNPLGMLSDCHRRIERFLGVLRRLGEEDRGGSLPALRRDALREALRYFREGAPKHTADEEQSVFPRLRAAAGAPDALNRLGALEADHRSAAAAHDELDALGAQWLATGSLPPGDAARFLQRSIELTSLYARHIEVEEREIFPEAGRQLSATHLHAIGVEMASRRGLAWSGDDRSDGEIRGRGPFRQHAARG